MQNRKAQMEISFGMIFSIIIIIAVLAIGFYVIRTFNSLSNCTSVGLFYNSLKKEVDQAWTATTSKSLFSGKVPGGVSYVCFGNLTISNIRSVDVGRRSEILNHYKFSNKDNVFVYPTGEGSCTPDLGNTYIEKAKIDQFFCSKVSGGKLSVAIVKNDFDALVTIQPA